MSESTDQNNEIKLEVNRLTADIFSNGTALRALDNISFQVHRGDIVGIAGESGAGKSLLAKSLLRLTPGNIVLGGNVLMPGKNNRPLNLLSLPGDALQQIRGQRLAIQFQDPAGHMNPVLTCGDQIRDALPEEVRTDGKSWPKKVIDYIELAGFDDGARIARFFPHELSGGMVQRIGLACALAGSPEILIVDEPTSALDPITNSQLVKTLLRLNEDLGLALIVISHDLSFLTDLTREIIVIYHGRVVESGPTEVITTAPLHPYTAALLECEDAIVQKSIINPLEGNPPGLLDKISGCHFKNRCRYFQKSCDKNEPELEVFSAARRCRCKYPLK